MLGPPVCIPCMRLLDGGHEEGRYWQCDVCGNDGSDQTETLVTHLFLLSQGDIEKVLKDRPEILEIVNSLKDLNGR